MQPPQLDNKLRFYEIFEIYYGGKESCHKFIGCPIDYYLEDEQQPERGYGDVLYRDTEDNLHFCFAFVEERKVGSGDFHVQVRCDHLFSGKSREEILEAFQEWYLENYGSDYTPPLLESPPKVEDMHTITLSPGGSVLIRLRVTR